MPKIHEMITEESWCRESMALDEDGMERCAQSPKAVCWCSLGWLEKTYGLDSVEKHIFSAQNQIALITDWNDASERTFEEVREAFRKADL